MKKNNKEKIGKFIFIVFFISFLVIYFSDMAGYYEYQNYKKSSLTEEQIKKFEEDVNNGIEIDINQYLIQDEKKYNNSLSKLASKLSDGISKVVNSGVEYVFKSVSKFIEE